MGFSRQAARALPLALVTLAGVGAAAALGAGAWDPAWLRVAPWPVADVGSSSLLRVPGVEGGFSAEQQGPDGRLLWRLTGSGLRSRSLREHALESPRLLVHLDAGAPLELAARAATIELLDPQDRERNPQATRVVVHLTGDVAAQGSGWTLAAREARVELAEPDGRDAPRRLRVTCSGPTTLGAEQGGWSLRLEASGVVAASVPPRLQLVGPIAVLATQVSGSAASGPARRVEGLLDGLILSGLPADRRSGPASGTGSDADAPVETPPQRARVALRGVALTISGQDQGRLLAAQLETDLVRDPAQARAALGGTLGACAGPRVLAGGASWRLERLLATTLDAALARVSAGGAPSRRARWSVSGERLELRAGATDQGGEAWLTGAARAGAGEDLVRAPALHARWSGVEARVDGEGGLTWERRTPRKGREELHTLRAERVSARLVPQRAAWEAERGRRRGLRARGLRLFVPGGLLALEARGAVELEGPDGIGGRAERLGWEAREQLLRLEGSAAAPARLNGPGGALTARALAAWQVGAPLGPPTWLLAAAGQVEARLETTEAGGGPSDARALPPLRLTAGRLLALLREDARLDGQPRGPTPWALVAGGSDGLSLAEVGGGLSVRASELSTRAGPRGPVLALSGRAGAPLRLEREGSGVTATAADLHLLAGGQALGLEIQRGWQASFFMGPSAAPRPATAEGQELYLELDRAALAGPRPGDPTDPQQAARRLRALSVRGGLRLDAAGLSARADGAELVAGTRTLRLSGAPAVLLRDGSRHQARELLLHLEE